MAAFGDYDQLCQSIANELERDDLSGEIPVWVRFVEAELARDLRLHEAERSYSGTFSTGVSTLSLPRDLLWLRHVQVDATPPRPLKLVSMARMTAIRDGNPSGPPGYCAHIGLNLELAPTPSEDEPYTMIYMARLVPLGPDNPSNMILDDAPEVLFYGALYHAGIHVKDLESAAAYKLEFETKKRSYAQMMWRRRSGPSTMRARVDFALGDAHTTRS